MTHAKIYHNPRCSKSRQTLQQLQDLGIDTQIIEYLKTPPSKAALKHILTRLRSDARAIMRRQDALYQDSGLAREDLSQEQLLDALVSNPALLERPIVILDDEHAVIARSPEKVPALLAHIKAPA